MNKGRCESVLCCFNTYLCSDIDTSYYMNQKQTFFGRRWRIIAALGLAMLLLAAGVLFISRNAILRSMADKRIKQIEQSHGLRIRYANLHVSGLKDIILDGLSVVPADRDTLLTLQSVDVRISLNQLLMGNIEIRNVRLDGLKVDFIKQDSIANYDFLFRPKGDTPATPTPSSTDYAARVDKLLHLLYGFLPENGDLNHLHITERKDTNFVSIHIPALTIRNNHFRADIHIKEDTLAQQWSTTGELNQNTHSLQASLHAPENKKISLPYINRRFGAEVSFDSLAYSLSEKSERGIPLCLTGKASISGLSIYHKALSPEVVYLDKGELDYRFNLAERAIELDSTTTVRFNKLQFHPYIHAEKPDTAWHFRISVNKPWFPADDLFGSLPKGLFSNLDGIKTSGELMYHFLLDMDFAQLDSLKFESELKDKDFRIVQYGATNLGKMSGEFIYTAYEYGHPVRSFPVGPSCPHFTPLDSISPLLQMAIQQSEDGAFYYHRGFLPDAMREALIHDLKVKRFARGGSTITMQLVKNVFLNRNKNIARKLEEALIVWLIENEGLTSKARMYEVYLNIIEWGPLVYGAHEASAFYFNKRPSQLNTEECIFLASIIPSPKRYRSSFNEDMQLKESMGDYYHVITKRLVEKGLIDSLAADSIRPQIQVTGDARLPLEK